MTDFSRLRSGLASAREALDTRRGAVAGLDVELADARRVGAVDVLRIAVRAVGGAAVGVAHAGDGHAAAVVHRRGAVVAAVDGVDAAGHVAVLVRVGRAVHDLDLIAVGVPGGLGVAVAEHAASAAAGVVLVAAGAGGHGALAVGVLLQPGDAAAARVVGGSGVVAVRVAVAGRDARARLLARVAAVDEAGVADAAPALLVRVLAAAAGVERHARGAVGGDVEAVVAVAVAAGGVAVGVRGAGVLLDGAAAAAYALYC